MTCFTGRRQAGFSGIGFGGSAGNLFGAAENVVSGVFGAAGGMVPGVGHVATGVVDGMAGRINQGAGHISGYAGSSGYQQVDAGIIGGGHQQANDRIHFGNDYQQAGSIGGGHINGGGLIAGQSSEHLNQAANQGSLSAVNANSFIDAGDSSRISTSKSSSSSSNKSAKRKTNSNFEGSSSNIDLGAQGSSQSRGKNLTRLI